MNPLRHFWNSTPFYTNRPSVFTKPVNPDTETALFWNRFPERFKAPFTRIRIKDMRLKKSPGSCGHGPINGHRNFIPKSGKYFWLVKENFPPIRRTTQIWVVPCHRYRWISALVFQTSFGVETSGDVAECRLFSQVSTGMVKWNKLLL